MNYDDNRQKGGCKENKQGAAFSYLQTCGIEFLERDLFVWSFEGEREREGPRRWLFGRIQFSADVFSFDKYCIFVLKCFFFLLGSNFEIQTR